jgi:hypothetical protein
MFWSSQIQRKVPAGVRFQWLFYSGCFSHLGPTQLSILRCPSVHKCFTLLLRQLRTDHCLLTLRDPLMRAAPRRSITKFSAAIVTVHARRLSTLLSSLTRRVRSAMEKYLRSWRQDALNRGQHDAAIYIGDKVLALTSMPLVSLHRISSRC